MINTKIKLNKENGSLSLAYTDGRQFTFSGEFLRVHSPSAEVRGHGKGQEVLQHGKKDVKVIHLEPTGNYAIRLIFNDEHDTGIYSWEYLQELGENQEQYWEDYLQKLQTAGKHRDASVQVVQLMDPRQ